MNSVTFKVIRHENSIHPVDWSGLSVLANGQLGRLFRWNGLYKVTLRTSRKWGMFSVTEVDTDHWSYIDRWADGVWAYYTLFCIPALAKLPVGVPFNAHTEWLRKATKAELERRC